MDSPFRLLIRHFLRRFFDNDLVSPDADRHETLAMLATALLVPTLFFTVLQSIKYLTGYRTPGINLVESLDDKFVYVSLSMLVMALAAVLTWDALGIEDRDASILGPLPVSHRAIAAAKLVAVLLFAGGLAVALNLIPTIIYPSLLAVRFPFSTAGFLRLTAAHAFTTMAAGTFAFLSILAVREVLRAVIGGAAFRRVTGLLRGALLVIITTPLLLMPWLSRNVNAQWIADERFSRALPPLWFIGLHEHWTGDVLLAAPPERYPLRLVIPEQRALELYTGYGQYFADMATMAVTALAIVSIVALAAYAWNARALPVPGSIQRLKRGALAHLGARAAQRLFARTPVAQAGFFFTLATLARSIPHRMIMATWTSLGLASTALIVFRDETSSGPAVIPFAWVAVQTVLVAAVVAGVRHAIRVPAELGANWTFQMCWSGHHREYLRGSMRAAQAMLVWPILIALVPLHVWIGGWRFALMHLFWGVLIASTMLAALLIGYDRLPFTGTYAQKTTFKSWAPLYVSGFWTITQILAAMERAALRDASAAAWLGGFLLLVLAGARRSRRPPSGRPGSVIVAEAPEATTQRLGLSG